MSQEVKITRLGIDIGKSSFHVVSSGCKLIQSSD